MNDPNVQTESYNGLDHLPELQQEQLAHVLDEYLSDLERGVVRSPDELLVQHPEIADGLKRALDNLKFVNRLVTAFPTSHRDAATPQLGDYQILRELGRGGMGIVYQARQLSLGRMVALKVLPFAAVLDQTQVQRFQNEAQAAAQLQHPHIVPVFAVGQERGVHYYSMQFIDGQALDQALRELREAAPQAASLFPRKSTDSTRSSSRPIPIQPADPQFETVRGLSTHNSIRNRNYVRSAVELTIQVADAIHYAHECGIIHRDIKPSNLLIDRRGKIWVADFGLARIQSSASLTLPGGACGTLRYMSPEQAENRTAQVDHRTDIFSLGVTLFEILALRPPFDADDRNVLVRQIAEHEPPSLRRINPSVPVDLETIVLKTLSKNRDDRYQTAEDLANDLRRFLAGRPTLARRPTAWDRGTKWVARRAKLVSVALVVTLVGLIAAAVTSWRFASLNQRTQQALSEAELHLRVARSTVDDFSANLSEQLASIPGAESVRLNALERAAQFYAEFARYAAKDPRWNKDAAIAEVKRAIALIALGSNDAARNAFEEASKRFEQLIVTRSGDADVPLEAALCANHYALFLARQGDFPAAASMIDRAALRLIGSVDNTGDERLQDARVIVVLSQAAIAHQAGELRKARETLDQAVSISRPLMAKSISAQVNSERKLRHAVALRQLAEMEHPAADKQRYLEAVSLLRESFDRSVGETAIQAELAACLHGLGSLENQSRNFLAAKELLTECCQLRRDLCLAAPKNFARRSELVASLNQLGTACQPDDPKAAQALFREAGDILETLIRQMPEESQLKSELGIVRNNEGLAREKMGDFEGSLALFDNAAHYQKLAFESSNSSEPFRQLLDQHRVNSDRVRAKIDRLSVEGAQKDRKSPEPVGGAAS